MVTAVTSQSREGAGRASSEIVTPHRGSRIHSVLVGCALICARGLEELSGAVVASRRTEDAVSIPPAASSVAVEFGITRLAGETSRTGLRGCRPPLRPLARV